MNISNLLDSIENKIQQIQDILYLPPPILLSKNQQKSQSLNNPEKKFQQIQNRPMLFSKNQPKSQSLNNPENIIIYTYVPTELSKIQTNSYKYNFLEEEHTKVKNAMKTLNFKSINPDKTKLSAYRKFIKDIGNILKENFLITHQKMRFLELELLLLNNSDVNVYLPGYMNKYHHFAQGFGSIACSQFKNKTLQQQMITHLNYLVAYLMQKYPDRVHLDRVPYVEASNTKICVFTANISNWNEEHGKSLKSWGGQAKAAKSHRVGIFGISTMPEIDESLLHEPLISHFT